MSQALSLPLLLQVLRGPDLARRLTLVEWDVLLRQATSAQLTAALVCLFDDAGLTGALPAPVRAHIEWARVRMQRHAHAVQFEIQCILAALADLSLPLLLLKGAAYSAAQLGPAQGRLFSDIDILVPKAQLPDVEAALMAHGWVSNSQDDYDQRYYRQWMHEIPPMQHMRRHSVIDVHHAILPETARVRPDPALLRAAAVGCGDAHSGDAACVAEHFVKPMVPFDRNLAFRLTREQAVLQDFLGLQFVTPMDQSHMAGDIGEV